MYVVAAAGIEIRVLLVDVHVQVRQGVQQPFNASVRHPGAVQVQGRMALG